MVEFERIKRLPPYVFTIVNDLKAKARARGEDIIDFGMGNPDQPTPRHIVEKLAEAARRSDTHRYSMSRGIPRLRRAICGWYQRRFDVDLDSESQAIVSIGSKEGLAHLALATMGSGEAVLVPNPAYPIHPFGFVIAGADIRHVPLVPGVDFFAELEKAIRDSWPKPKMLVLNFPGNPTTRCVDLDFFVSTGAGSGLDLEHGSGVRSRLVPLLSYSCGHGQATATGMSRCAVPPHRVWQPHCTRYHIGGKPACTTKTSLRLNWKIAYRSNRLILSPRV